MHFAGTKFRESQNYCISRVLNFVIFLKNAKIAKFKVTFAPNLAKKKSTNFYYLSLLFQLSVAYSENFKEIKALDVLKFWKEKIRILPIYFAWRQEPIVFTLCQVCTLYENYIT